MITWQKTKTNLAPLICGTISSVISWVEATFKVYRKEMKGIEWAFLYDDFKDENLDPDKLELEINKLMQDDEVQKKKR